MCLYCENKEEPTLTLGGIFASFSGTAFQCIIKNKVKWDKIDRNASTKRKW